MNKKIIFKSLQEPAEASPLDNHQWLTTFNDMITLLMVFFVLLFSMGNMDVKRFKHFQNALQSAMGVLNQGRHTPAGIIAGKPVDAMQADAKIPESTTIESNKTQLENTKGLEAEYTPKGIHLTLDDNLLFASGSSKLTAGGTVLLEKVARIIKPLNRAIRVEGHTDNRPIATSVFPSNWELSTARAISVVKYLIDAGGIAPHLLAAAGYGDSKPRAPNDSEINMSKNRRVEIILGQVVENGGNQYVE
jgi:chemotaxis protein MotB